MSIATTNALAHLIKVWSKEYGEGEYAYFRIAHHWRSDGKKRRSGHHYTSTTHLGTPITKDDYYQELEKGREMQGKAFMGEMRGRSYITVRRRVVTPGWREKLLEEVKILVEAE